jgi:type IV pilus assembly protein PilW
VSAVLKCRLQPLPAINTAPESSKIYNSFYVDNTKKTLECMGSRSAATVTIADGVENMQFLYGVDVNTDGTVDRYANATVINSSTTDNLDWGGVIAIQAAILVRSLKPVKNTSEVKSFTLLDTVVTAPDDKFQRAVFSTTIFLQNTL